MPRKRTRTDFNPIDKVTRSKRRKTSHRDATSTSPRKSKAASHPVLSIYYPRVITLREYLLLKLPRHSRSRRRALLNSFEVPGRGVSRTSGLNSALDGTLIGFFEDTEPGVEANREREFKAFTQSQLRSSDGQHSSSDVHFQEEVRQTNGIMSLLNR